MLLGNNFYPNAKLKLHNTQRTTGTETCPAEKKLWELR